MTNSHVQSQLPPITSAKIPCKRGIMPPPMTPIVSTPDALVVYFPSWSVANVKMVST